MHIASSIVPGNAPTVDNAWAPGYSRHKHDSWERSLLDMVFVSRRAAVIGTSADERAALAQTYDCDATWLKDEIDKQAVDQPAFWIDRSPVTNAEYCTFV